MNSNVFVALALLVVAASAQQFQTFQQRRVPAILRQSNVVAPDGSSFSYGFQTENGINVDATGSLGAARSAQAEGPALTIRGQYSYTGPDGRVYTVQYVADEDGYRATGAHLPVPPPVPEAIQRSIEFNLRNAQPNQPGAFRRF